MYRKINWGSLAVYVLLSGTSIAALMTACATTQKVKDSDAQLAEDEQKKLNEFRAELEVGRNMAGRLLQFYGTQEDDALLGYVNQVGAYLAGYSSDPQRKYMIEILDSEIINAFACPGGYILLTMGAVRHARNEAELAGVIAHEIEHVGHKHMFDKIRNMSKEEMEEANEIAKKNILSSEVLQARARPTPEESDVGKTLAKYLSTGAAGLNIVKAAGAGMAVMLEQGLGAEKEYEADAFGTKTAVSAGYDPKSYSQFLCRIKKPNAKGYCKIDEDESDKKKDGHTILDRTHPPLSQRLKNIAKTLNEMSADEIVGAKGTKRFNKFHSRLPDKKA